MLVRSANYRSFTWFGLSAGVILFMFFVFVPNAHAATRTWDGGGVDDNWSTCANWSADTCPTSADLALFDSTSSDNSTIDASFAGSVQGLQISSGYTGTITQSRSLTIDSGGFSQAAATFEQGTQTFDINNGTFTLSAGTFNSGAATSTFERNFTISGGTYNASSRVVQFDGTSTDTTTLTCTGTLSGIANIAKSSNSSFILASGCAVDFATTTSTGGPVTINGTANFGSTLNIDHSFTLNSGSTLTFSSATPTITIEGNFTLDSAATFDATGKTITFDGTSTDSTTFTCSGAFGGVVNIAKGSAPFTLVSGCEITLPSTTATVGSIVVDGTMNSGSTLDINGSLTLNSGSTLAFSAPTPTITIENNFTLDPNATFDASGKTLTFDGTSTDPTTFTCTGTFDGLVNISKGNATFTLASGCGVVVAGTTSTTGAVVLNGTLDIAGFSITATSLTVASTGTLKLQGAETTITTPTLLDGSTVEYAGSSTYTSLRLGATYSSLAFTGSGTWATSTSLTVARNFNQTAGIFNHTSTLTFTGTSTYYATTTANSNFQHVTLNASGGTLVLAGSGLDIAGDLTITAGTLDASTNKCSSASCPITLTGDWLNSGTFTPRTGTTTFAGTAQSLSGATTFYNLAKSVSSATTLTFPASATQTIQGTLTLNGASGNLLSLRSSSPSTQWSIDPQGTRTISFLDVQDSNNTNATAISAGGLSITNSGNNTNWDFNTAPSTPTSLGATAYVDGSWGNDTTPTLTFTTADGDGNTVRYQLQVDDSSDFSSAVVDYLSAFATAGVTSFTVGQATGTGSYIAGLAGQTLSDGTYYWRVRAADSTATSSYATANSGSVAFGIDTTAPTAGSVALSATTTTSLTATISGASDALSGLSATPYTLREGVTDTYESATSSTSRVFSSLTPNTQYSFTVGVADAAGNVATTSAKTGYTLAAVPTSFAGSADSSSQITVSWSAGLNPAGTEYFAENTTDSSNSGWITTTSWASTGLSGSTEYDFTVMARNGDSIETATLTGSATTNAVVDGGSDTESTGSAIRIKTRIGCEDSAALNYGQYHIHDPSLCIYEDDEETGATAPFPVPDAIQSLVMQHRALFLSAERAGIELPAFVRTLLGIDVAAALTFTRDLELGASGEDVRALQAYLNTKGFTVAVTGAGSAGEETTLFGPATKAALMRFQEAKGIAPAAGYFGPVTRAYVNAH